MPTTTSHKITDSLYLIGQTLEAKAATTEVVSPTNHIVVIDCSGSMSGELPEIRTQLKKKLPKLLAEQDTLSIVWFSGKGQFGVLIENEPVATLADLKDVEKAIDRWLKPVGLTGFKEPLVEVQALIERVGKARPGSVFSLFFMSDGQDNQWSKADILKTVESVSGSLAAATFVEYGYYADRPLLTSMAEKAGGSLVHAKDFDSYQPVFEAAMAKKIMGGKRVEVEIGGDPIGGFVYALTDGDLVTFGVQGGKVLVPEGLQTLYYVSPSSIGTVQTDVTPVLGAAYAAMSLYSTRMKSDVILPFLKATGDVAFVEQFAGLFGKQAYSAFMDATKAAAFDPTKRLTKGYDPNKVPREDAYTVLDFLRALSGDDKNRLLLDHEAFRYNRIGRGRVDATSVLTDEEQAEVAKLTAEMAQTKDAKKVAVLAGQIAALTNKPEALKFEAAPAPEGYSITNLTYNEDRPNISVLVKKPGTVDISARNPPAGIPSKFETFVYRNYAIVKDGLVNVKVLPCRVNDQITDSVTQAILDGRAPAEAFTFNSDGTMLANLDKLPVINRQMVKEVSADDFFTKSYALTQVQAEAKVYNTIKKEQFPRKSEGFSALYGEDGANWLKEQGFTDYSGFNPKAVQAEATDFYMGKELKTSLKGLSSLPTLKVARENIAKNKVNAPTALMQPAIQAVDTFLASDAYKSAADPAALFETWLDGHAKVATDKSRALLREIAETTFTIIVGQVWPKEFGSLDENTRTLTIGGTSVEGKMEQREVEIKL
jgi:hypothetical protein